jgi:hypothetical protein
MGVQLTKKQTKTGYAFYDEVTDTFIIFIKGYGSDHSWSERCWARLDLAAYRTTTCGLLYHDLLHGTGARAVSRPQVSG